MNHTPNRDASVIAACNLCGSVDSRHLFTKRDWHLRRCDGCGLVRLDPLPNPAQIAAWYAPTAGYQLARLQGSNRYTRWEQQRSDLLASITGAPPRADARLLDVGCSTGDFLERARRRGWSAQGIELAKHLATFARVKRGLPVEHGGIDAIVSRFGDASFNTITLWDVIEHLPNPLDAMHLLHRALEPGGTLYVSTPNLDGWVPRFHWRFLRPATEMWPHPEPPLHLYQFSRATIARLFRAAGFSRVELLPDEIPLWYTSGFLGEPTRREWLRGETGVRGARSLLLTTLPVSIAARLFNRGDSMIVRASR